jgi:hypothetical protein
MYYFDILESLSGPILWQVAQFPQNYPQARSGHSGIVIAGSVYIFGGRSGDDLLGDLWRFKLETEEWI